MHGRVLAPDRLASGPSERERTDAELTATIQEIHTELHGHPGVRRGAELVVRGVRVARKRTWRLMQAAGLQGRHPRAWKKTTVAGLRPIDAPDLDRSPHCSPSCALAGHLPSISGGKAGVRRGQRPSGHARSFPTTHGSSRARGANEAFSAHAISAALWRSIC
jgi:hypothetical protein